ncbi:MAG TPA: hypothetical protein VNW68_00765, partial [Candidatus Limnocylindria bacterium]|nr:hypothetical protein [Candidatus Limnocylindria bacterium]
MNPWDEFLARLDWIVIGDIGFRLGLVVLATLVALAFVSIVVRAALSRLFQREVEEGSATR